VKHRLIARFCFRESAHLFVWIARALQTGFHSPDYAQTALDQARNTFDDGLSRHRIAIATIQTLTGNY
jgi:hypothetical protein